MRLLLSLVPAVLAAVLIPTGAQAHPLGNFTTNQYAGLRISPTGVTVDYVLDLAELPAFTDRTQSMDIDRNGDLTAAERERYANVGCARAATRNRLTLAGRDLPLTAHAHTLSLPPGAGGLTTVRLECELVATVNLRDEREVTFTLADYADRIGWREITAVGDRSTLLAPSVPAASVSARLTAYPAGALDAPRDVRTVSLRVRPGGAAAPSGDSALASVARYRDAFTDLVSRRRLTVGFTLLGILIAVALGAGHALAPGHGKTVMAAYLMGQRGNRAQALGMGLTVAVTHTVGVLVLGVVLATTIELAPDRVYAWLGAASGMLLAVLGGALLVRSVRSGRTEHSHHQHAGHDHDHGPDMRHTSGLLRGPSPTGRREVFALGLVGGLAPSPSAIVVLLGAVALGRAWYGVLLVIAYGLGMAATLTGIGLLLARLGSRIERGLGGRLSRLVPMLTSVAILAIGVGLAAEAWRRLG